MNVVKYDKLHYNLILNFIFKILVNIVTEISEGCP